MLTTSLASLSYKYGQGRNEWVFGPPAASVRLLQPAPELPSSEIAHVNPYPCFLTAAVQSIDGLTATIWDQAHQILATIDMKEMLFMVPLQEAERDCFAFTWEGVQLIFTGLPQGQSQSLTMVVPSEDGNHFTAGVPQEWAKGEGIHPQANGIVERKKGLLKCVFNPRVLDGLWGSAML